MKKSELRKIIKETIIEESKLKDKAHNLIRKFASLHNEYFDLIKQYSKNNQHFKKLEEISDNFDESIEKLLDEIDAETDGEV